jgi:Zn finger protein HypA/HybF involved in hydrogenase expression
LSSEPRGEIRFECLHCGKTSILDILRKAQPKCARCGSMTGVLGDIGQGTAAARRERSSTGAAGDRAESVEFQCLSCGHATLLAKVDAPPPQCAHCGALSGVLTDRDSGTGYFIT